MEEEEQGEEAFSIASFGDFCRNTFAYYGNHRTLPASAVLQTKLPALTFCSLI